METLQKNPSALFPLPLLCPSCQGARLTATGDAGLHCGKCGAGFEKQDGFYDLIVGDRFSDEADDECLRYEEQSNTHTAENYWVPLFSSLVRDRPRPIRVLALGCGTGMEVDVLNAAGFECIGIDCGNRPRAWRQRTHQHHFLLANGMRLPFETSSFDIAFCGCVFPHVGVKGDSFVTTERCAADRMRLASEMVRVLRPGGYAIASSPNRRFPLDLFHGRKAGSYIPRVNRPGERFLLSAADYRELFTASGCGEVRCLSTGDYWGFVRSKKSLKGAVLGIPVRLAFWLTSLESARFLRPSPIAPWIVIQARKK